MEDVLLIDDDVELCSMLTEYLGKNGTTPAAYGDVLWAVLNSSEFTLVR